MRQPPFTFHGFDQAVAANAFWRKPIAEVNANVCDAHREDNIARPGVTLVVGCGVPTEIQSYVLLLREEIEGMLAATQPSVTVKWRDDLAALHVTVYGLVKPRDYQRGSSWPVPNAILRQCAAVIKKHRPFRIAFQGFGVLGRGAVAVRTSDSDALDSVRDRIEEISGLSARGFGEKVNQMIIGRLLPPLTVADRHALGQLPSALQDFQRITCEVQSLELIHYKHEFLDRLFGQQVFP